MKAPEFTPSAVELGGHDAAAKALPSPTPMPRWTLWLIVVVIIVYAFSAVLFAPKLLATLEPDGLRVTAGDVTFIPAYEWRSAPNPSAAATNAVTYQRSGATFSIWTQSGSDPESLAREIAAEFFPVEYRAGTYYVREQTGTVEIRPKQSADMTRVSMVQVMPVDPQGVLPSRGSHDYPDTLTVIVSEGPATVQSGEDGNFTTLWNQVNAMSSTVAPRQTS